MKKLKILSLKDDVKVLTSVEMKMLRGGCVWCHCYGNSGEVIRADKCSQCPSKCSDGVQNCNYIA